MGHSSIRWLLFALTALVASTACSSETGILVRTSTDTPELSAQIESLRFFVGENLINTPGYFTDKAPAEDTLLQGRDIYKNPFSLLLRPPSDHQINATPLLVAAVAYNAQGELVAYGQTEQRLRFVSENILKWNLELKALTPEANVLVTPTGCLQWVNANGDYTHIGRPGDQDCDGFEPDISGRSDCNDLDPNISPSIAEICDNGIDDDCNGKADDDDTIDNDGDGFSSCGAGVRDCNDGNNQVYPGAPEICDGIDNDCDQECDEIFDEDKDGFIGDQATCNFENGLPCQGHHATLRDCNDDKPNIFPNAVEICNGEDDNCDGNYDELAVLDPDQDGYTECGSIPGLQGTREYWIDCEPTNPDIHPGAHDLCNGIDDDCNGMVDDSLTQYPCFEKSNSGAPTCAEGIRRCRGGVLEAGCFVMTETPDNKKTPIQWCDSYAQDCRPDIPDTFFDPFVCSLDFGKTQTGIPGLITETCTVSVKEKNSEKSELCNFNTTLPIPVLIDNDDTCTFSIIGGKYQQGFKVFFPPLEDTQNDFPANIRTRCNNTEMALNIRMWKALWPGDAWIPIHISSEEGVSVDISLHLQSEFVDSCTVAGVAPIACESWSFP